MKVAVILEDTISAGGGFNQALNAIIQFERLSRGKFTCLVLTSRSENLQLLNELGFSAINFSSRFLDKAIAALGSNELTRRVLRRFRWTSPFERLLLDNACDLAYFVTPTARVACLHRINYILTIWDNCHRDFPEFPEVRSFGEFKRREFIYNFIPQAYLTLVDSDELGSRLHQRYGVDPGRLLTMPFSPNPMLRLDSSIDVKDILDQYKLTPGFFLYPAQFWPHKNHLRIVQALTLLKSQGESPIVVFVGGNKGNQETVMGAVDRAGLQEQILNLGFVPTEHLHALYQSCCAVVMPTYFGPTNLPPLEAWQARRPLIYSQHLAQQCNGAALLIDPDDPRSLANAMLQSQKIQIRDDLIKRGEKRQIEIAEQREHAETKFLVHLKSFEQRCMTWTQ